MPVFPGAQPEKFYPIQRMPENPCNVSSITHAVHNGTHVDAPFHFDQTGTAIDAIPIENFLFRSPIVAECPHGKGELISVENIQKTR